ncbi:MAG: metal ABC transporter ATP-binding protein [Halanaerobiales bacterium]
MSVRNKKQLKLCDVSVYYNNQIALKNINFSVNRNQFLGIIGPNGGGKTTLLKVIAGLLEPDKGQILFYSKKGVKSENISIGYVPQASNFDQKFPINVFDVVLMGGINKKFKPFYTYNNIKKDKAKDLMKKVGIYNLKDKQIGQLSGGQLQKVLITRALMTEPELLLLDEPTASLDSSSTSNIYEMLVELNENITIIVVTHNLTAVSSYFDSLACLNQELFYHDDKELDSDTVKKVYGCPVELLAHGIPHRVLATHEEE